MRKIIISFLCVMMLGITGCSSGGSGNVLNEEPAENNKAKNSNPVQIEDIDWLVEDAYTGSQRFVGFSYTNNSK